MKVLALTIPKLQVRLFVRQVFPPPSPMHGGNTPSPIRERKLFHDNSIVSLVD